MSRTLISRELTSRGKGLTLSMLGSSHIPLTLFDAWFPQEAGAVRRLAVDGLALVYHIMGNANKHRLHLELG